MSRTTKIVCSLVIALALILSFCGATPTAPPRTVNVADTQITVGSPQSHAIPNSFNGFNIEMSYACKLLQVDAANPAFYEQLYKNLGSSTLHINGHSADEAQWSATGDYSCSSENTVVTPAFVDALVAFANHIGWHIVWGLNLISNTPAMDAAEATYVASSAGATLSAFNIGNEPGAYTYHGYRPAGWTYTNYLTEWRAAESAVLAAVPGARIDAPDVSGSSSFYASFASSEASDAALLGLSHHYYITATPQSIATMLAPSTMSAFLASVTTWQSATTLPFILSELNTFSNGGVAGVTNTLAASLWLADASLATAAQGVAQLDLQQSGSVLYDALDPNTGQPTPLYYGLLLAHTMMRLGTFDSLSLTTSHNLDAYAVKVSDGTLRVIVVNKDGSDADAQITLPATFATGSYYTLAGPAIDATTGVTLDDRGVSASGTWSANNPTTISVGGDVVDLVIPADTALALTLTP